eukprot:SAG11_NODE_1746_length_4331_cov_2.793715_2_plen_92_part_00
MFNSNQPACFVPFEHAKRQKVVHDGHDGTRNRRVAFCIQPSVGRSAVKVLSPAMAATNQRHSPARIAARHKFFACLKRAHETMEEEREEDT